MLAIIRSPYGILPRKINSEEDIKETYSFVFVKVGKFCGDFGTNVIRNVTMYNSALL